MSAMPLAPPPLPVPPPLIDAVNARIAALFPG